MADESKVPKVGTPLQDVSDAYYSKKASQIRAIQGQKVLALKQKNKVVGVLLAAGAFAICILTLHFFINTPQD